MKVEDEELLVCPMWCDTELWQDLRAADQRTLTQLDHTQDIQTECNSDKMEYNAIGFCDVNAKEVVLDEIDSYLCYHTFNADTAM